MAESGDGDARWMARRQRSWRVRREAEFARVGMSEPSSANPRLHHNPYVRTLLYGALVCAGLGLIAALAGAGGGLWAMAALFFVAWLAVSAILWRPPN